MSKFTLPLDIKSLKIISQQIDKQGNIIFEVRSKHKETKCHKCGQATTKRYGHAPEMKFRHTSILEQPVYLHIKPVRYQCENCDDHPTTTEQYDWCSRNAKTTQAFEDYLMRSLIHSTVQDVSRKERVGYKTVVSALNRKIDKTVDWDEFTNLEIIGVDEIASKKGYNDYFSIISAKMHCGKLRILAVIKGRTYDAVKSFLDSISKNLKQTVKSVCTDMHDGFISAAAEVFGSSRVVVDRYHVAKLYRKRLDKLRISEMARLKKELSDDEYSELEGMMWILRKKHECLSKTEKDKLGLLYKYSAKLKQAPKFALKLTQIFNAHSSRKAGLEKLGRWITSVEKNEVKCFKTFIKVLKKYRPYIVNYFKDRETSGFVGTPGQAWLNKLVKFQPGQGVANHPELSVAA